MHTFEFESKNYVFFGIVFFSLPNKVQIKYTRSESHTPFGASLEISPETCKQSLST